MWADKPVVSGYGFIVIYCEFPHSAQKMWNLLISTVTTAGLHNIRPTATVLPTGAHCAVSDDFWGHLL